MSDLPKRGDRVRVTEILSGSFIRFSEEITLIEDARPCPNWGEGACVCIYEGRNGNGFGRTWSGPVKVEIPERADRFDCCGGSDEHPPEHTQDCSARQESERVCADCGLPVSHRVHRGFGPCGGQSTKTIHPEFARGMRTAVELAEQHLYYCQGWDEFDAAIKEELK